MSMSTGPFRLSRSRGLPVTEAELINDLKRVALLLNAETVTQPQYSLHGTFDMRNLSRRLGGWSAALAAAGLNPTLHQGEYTDEQLFANVLVMWQHFGRQPRRAELAYPPSEISQSPYHRRFGSWSKALAAFVIWANATEVALPQPAALGAGPRTARDPSLRLHFKVLLRDRFACCGCGRSPAMSPGTELHVDHIVPWSKGGETIFENLRTMCAQCNIGRSNVL